MKRKNYRSKVAEKVIEDIKQVERYGFAYEGAVPEGCATALYRAGYRNLNPDLTRSGFQELALGGEFVILPTSSLPGELHKRIARDEDGEVRAILPAGARPWLRHYGLVAIATEAELAAGGTFTVRRWRETVVLEGAAFEDGEVLDRRSRGLGRLPRNLFERQAAWLARVIDSRVEGKPLTIVTPFRSDHVVLS